MAFCIAKLAMSLSPEFIASAQQAYSLYQQEQYQKALELTEALLSLPPQQPSLLNLAAVCARALGMPGKAEHYWRTAIELAPGYANAHANLGLVLQDTGRLEEAEAAFQMAIKLDPAHQEAMTSLGNLYRTTQRFGEAEAAYRKALAMAPENVNALYNLGLLLVEMDRPDEAETAFRTALKIQPNQADVYNDLGNVLMDRLRHDEAEQAYRKAIAIRPAYADAYCNLGMLLLERGRRDDAMAAFQRSLMIEPQHADALMSTANLLSASGHFDKAEQAYRKVLATRTDSATLYNNFGNLLKESHRYAEAEAAYRKAVSLQPDYGHALGQAVTCARSWYEWSRADADAQMVIRALEKGVAGIPALMVPSLPEALPEHLLKAGVLTAKESLKSYLELPPLVDPALHPSHERLRIGYLSAEFYEHAVMHLLAGVFEMHDRKQFEIHAYSIGPHAGDAYRQRIEQTCEFFHDIRAISRIDAARQIANDEIDILVDLSGHTGESRPAITALRPAPVIVNWLGYPGTLGLPRLADYIIGDAVLTPLEHASHFSETLAWMPHCYQPNDPKLMIGAKPTRQEAGLPEKGLVFCSFNQAYKLTPAMFTLWCRLLDAVPGSVLWLLHPGEASAIDNLLREASDRGIAPDRLAFGRKLPMSAHLARLQLADLALDTYPYGSGATGSNVLRAGVPMVTLMGDSYVSRMAASQLHAIGLPELVTTSAEDYFKLARDLALNPERLAMLREKLAGNLPTAPLFDTTGFTQDLERLYRRIWLDHERAVREPITTW
jgi:protein O-GlcNAc transferase